MLLKKNRLTKERDFLRILKQGQNYFSQSLIIKIKPNRQPDSRCGFIITRKNAKKAVTRNKIKRQLREIIKNDIIGIIKGGYDLVILFKKDVDLTKIKYENLRQEVWDLVNKSKLLK